jgi:hypothetical protein
LVSTVLEAEANQRYWIYFKDKGDKSSHELMKDLKLELNERALKRREMRGSGAIIDFTDLPLSTTYIAELENLGVRIYRQSKWLNAVSCYLDGVSIEDIFNLPFVLNVEKVKTNMLRPADNNGQVIENYEQVIIEKPLAENYGPSFNQNDMIGVPFAHEMGFHGEDVLIAIFDTGFILNHEALRHIEVVDAWDFIYEDGIVEDEEEDVPGQHNHGTQVLSIIAGYSPWRLIGPAYASKFLLAKTDHLTLENQQDEDNWVAAAEWAEGLGADVISSSVGYILDYSYEDLDGNTAAVTIAADLAVKKGVAVFNSAGNEGLTYWEYIIAPADGDSVIAIGGVTPDGDFWAISSRGPTVDGRTKPDLAAQGQDTYCVNPTSTDRYTTANGTSVACPLGAGAGAIVLSVMPTMSPLELRELLKRHASQSNNPDNFKGYGIINLEESIFELIGEPVVSVSEMNVMPRNGNNLVQWIVDLEVTNERWLISRKTPTTSFVEIGQIEGRDFGITTEIYSFYDFDVEGWESFTYKLSAQFASGSVTEIDSIKISSKEPLNITLSPNFPNPFNSETTIIFGLNSPQKVTLKIFDISGKLVRTLIDGQQLDARFHHILWDGLNNQNQTISSGTYFLSLTANGSHKTMKMLHLK